MLPEPDCGGVMVKAALVLSPDFESLNACSAGETPQPGGALRCKMPAALARSDVTSTSTLLLTPGLNNATVEPKFNATGAITVSLRGLPLSAVETGSSVTTSLWPATSKTNSTGKVGGFSGRPINLFSSTRKIPLAASSRSQYGCVGDMSGGILCDSSRETDAFARNAAPM